MPITQERMLELISAAGDYEECWNRMRESIADAENKVLTAELTENDAFYQLITSLKMIYPQPMSTRAIATEQKHFKLVGSRNILRRGYMAAKRGKADPYLLKARAGEAIAYVKAQQENKTDPAEQERIDQLLNKAAREVDAKMATKDSEITIQPDTEIMQPDDMADFLSSSGLDKTTLEAIEEERKATEEPEND